MLCDVNALAMLSPLHHWLLPVCPPACLPVCPPICLPACLSRNQAACQAGCLSSCLSVCLSVCLSSCLSGRLPVKCVTAFPVASGHRHTSGALALQGGRRRGVQVHSVPAWPGSHGLHEQLLPEQAQLEAVCAQSLHLRRLRGPGAQVSPRLLPHCFFALAS